MNTHGSTNAKSEATSAPMRGEGNQAVWLLHVAATTMTCRDDAQHNILRSRFM